MTRQTEGFARAFGEGMGPQGVPPTGSGSCPTGGAASASPAEPAIPNADSLRDAAPELYEALAGLMSFAESAEAKVLVGDEGCLWPMEFARAALAKARGDA